MTDQHPVTPSPELIHPMKPMTDFKQLCRDLMDALDSGIPGARIQCSPLAERARAALAEPEPEPEEPTPSDEELMALAVTVFEDPFATDVHYARAVLARWGTLQDPSH